MNGVKKRRTLLIAGPTASGKSAAALALAEKLDGEIVNADAIQVYKDLEIISARPGRHELVRAPHLLFGHIDGAVRYSVGEWLAEIGNVLQSVWSKGRVAIIVGGAGLYFRALTSGLAATPAISERVRSDARERLSNTGIHRFREEIIAFDPEITRLAVADVQRHLRAYEVFAETGIALSAWQNTGSTGLIDSSAPRVIIEPDRETLYSAIEERFDAMMDAGALDEVKRLAARGLNRSLPVMKAVGAMELLGFLEGDLNISEAIALAKRNSRRLAKRQLTWFRNQAADWPRAASSEEAVRLLAEQSYLAGGR